MKTTPKETNETKQQAKNAKKPQRKLPDLALKKDVRGGGDIRITSTTSSSSPELMK
jgi:hypothetical protein